MLEQGLTYEDTEGDGAVGGRRGADDPAVILFGVMYESGRAVSSKLNSRVKGKGQLLTRLEDLETAVEPSQCLPFARREA